MAIVNKNAQKKESLTPGARGEMFQQNFPGYNDGVDRINRSNNKLNTNAHDVPNIKYEFDRRLPVLFTYGFAQGYNQMVMPKGRIVAVDPYMDQVDWDTNVEHNTLTMANGGVPVRTRTASDTYQTFSSKITDIVSPEKQGQTLCGPKEWTPVKSDAYVAQTMRAFCAIGGTPEAPTYTTVTPIEMLDAAGYEVDSATGKIADKTTHTVVTNVRPGNIPLGIIARNEYTRNDDALNGIMPGAVLTDAMVELAWFTHKDKAEQNPWGSAYGGIFPGCKLKSDENGRFIPSPLSFPEILKTMDAAEIEMERQQIVGQVYATNNSLLPEGAAKYAQWALEDRLNFELYNPDTYRATNRDGEDTINNSPYNPTRGKGYAYEKSYGYNDLHMLASSRDYDARMNQEYQYGLGIPGLTDGYNAHVESKVDVVGSLVNAGAAEYGPFIFRTLETNVEKGSMQIKLGSGDFQVLTIGSTLGTDYLKVVYVNELQGIVSLEVTDKAKADAALTSPIAVSIKYNKRGLAGVPTFMDWDGCRGSVKILLQK